MESPHQPGSLMVDLRRASLDMTRFHALLFAILGEPLPMVAIADRFGCDSWIPPESLIGSSMPDRRTA